MASNAALELHNVKRFESEDPLSQGRRLTVIRRSSNAKRVLLLVHGLKSSAKTWIDFAKSSYGCDALQNVDIAAFEYQTSILGRLRFPFRKVDAEDWSRVLADTIEHSLLARHGYEQVVMVGHSMGGLVCKLAIQDLANEGQINTIQKIHSVFTYATPHFGSDRAFLPVAMLSYDVSFLRANAKALQSLQRFWNTRVGEGKELFIHERAIVSAKDEVVPVVSASGGLSQNDIFHVATSHTKVHCPDDAGDRRITWLCEQLQRIDRRSVTELVDIMKLPDPMSYRAQDNEFFAQLFEMVFVLAVGRSDGVEPGDQFQLFYEAGPLDVGDSIESAPSKTIWNLLEASRVEETKTYASMISFSGEIAMRRLERMANDMGIADESPPNKDQMAELIHAMFDHDIGRISRIETRAARPVIRAVKRVRHEDKGSNAWRRATNEVLEYAEHFLTEHQDSPIAEGVRYDRAYALLTLGRLEEARSKFDSFTRQYPFSVSVPGARQCMQEIEHRLAVRDAPGDLYTAFRLGTYLMGYGDFSEGVYIVWHKLLEHPDELSNFTNNTRLDLFAMKVAGDMLGLRFANRSEYANWARAYRDDSSLQEQVLEKIETCAEPERSLLLALHAGLPGDIDMAIAESRQEQTQ